MKFVSHSRNFVLTSRWKYSTRPNLCANKQNMWRIRKMDNKHHIGTILCWFTCRCCCRCSILLHHRWTRPDGGLTIAAEIKVHRWLIIIYLSCCHLIFMNIFSHLPSNRMPFDPTTYSGFTGVLLCGLIFGLTYLIITTAVALLFLSMGLYLEAFCSHYESIFRNMNKLVDEKIQMACRQMRLKACLAEAIDFHSQAKE